MLLTIPLAAVSYTHLDVYKRQVDIRKDANAQVILNQLYQYTQLQDTVGDVYKRQMLLPLLVRLPSAMV